MLIVEREIEQKLGGGYRKPGRGAGRMLNKPHPLLSARKAMPTPAVLSVMIASVVLWRLRNKLSLRDLAEMFLIRGFVFTYEAVRDWEAKLTPTLAKELRRSRKGKVGRSWYVDET
jgi:putative transposase